ncbi:MAG TPA: helix-turn-helix domain-containing protein, partial [Candidatus Baltobacteraceae bacterium]|nr:helix-turn-helix domain-containing protein [Candidatus Baltobacteraceae bacterium]
MPRAQESSTEALAFGELLRNFRLRAALSQEALAERAQLSAAGISALERGIRRAPYRETVGLLADALALSATDRARLESTAARPRTPRPRARGSLYSEYAPNAPPQVPSSFVGRGADVSAIRALLERGRLVTIVGAGGVGKTRTATQVCSELGANERICFVDLTSLSSGNLIVDTIVHAAGIRGAAPGSPLLPLLAHFAGAPLVIVLDNCEHLIADAALVAEELVEAFPQLRILATSREPIKVPAESVYRLRALRTPAPAEVRHLNAARALQFGAVELFVDRARAVDHRFELSDENAPLVADLCRRLEGMPLAIELAAARITAIPLKGLAEDIEHRLAGFTAADRRAPARQRTIRALIEWSFALLSPPEQRLFERLSLFAGGATLDAVLGVCSSDDLPEAEILATLAALIDKSLVVARLDLEEPRYFMLDSTGRYSAERLALRGERDAFAHRHATVYCEMAESIDLSGDTAPDPLWDAQLEAEVGNWRAALEWTLVARGDVELGQRLVGALRSAWVSLRPDEGRRWLALAFELADATTPNAVLAALDYANATLTLRFYESDVALQSARSAVKRFRELDNTRGLVRSLWILAHTMNLFGQVAAAEPLLREALELAERAKLIRLVGFLYDTL